MVFFITNLGYSKWNFDRTDLKCGAYGGRATNTTKIKKTPVIFIHGNSDVAFGRGTTDGYVSWQTGFRSLATFLSSKGYEKSEMYTTGKMCACSATNLLQQLLAYPSSKKKSTGFLSYQQLGFEWISITSD